MRLLHWDIHKTPKIKNVHAFRYLLSTIFNKIFITLRTVIFYPLIAVIFDESYIPQH